MWLGAWSLGRVWLFGAPWTVARQVPLYLEFPRQAYWSCSFLLQGIFQLRDQTPCLLHLLYWQAYSLPIVPPKTYPRCGMYQNFTPFSGWILFCCVYRPHLHLPSADRHLGRFYLSATIASTVKTLSEQAFVWLFVKGYFLNATSSTAFRWVKAKKISEGRG